MIFCRDILRNATMAPRTKWNRILNARVWYGTDNNRDVTVGRHGVAETNTRSSLQGLGWNLNWWFDSDDVQSRVARQHSRECDNLGAVGTPMTDIIAANYAYLWSQSFRKIISRSVRFIIMRATHIRLICETTLDAFKVKKSGGNFYYQLAILNNLIVKKIYNIIDYSFVNINFQ